MRTQFARWLDQEIERRGWSQKDLADATGASQGTVSKWISGIQQPTKRYIATLAKALQLPVETLYQRMGHIEQPPDLEPEVMECRQRLLFIFDQLRPNHQETVMMMAEGLLEQQRRAEEKEKGR